MVSDDPFTQLLIDEAYRAMDESIERQRKELMSRPLRLKYDLDYYRERIFSSLGVPMHYSGPTWPVKPKVGDGGGT